MAKKRYLSEIFALEDAKRDAERKRISNVLHDDVGALLSAVSLKLELLRMDGVEGLDSVVETLEKGFGAVRALSRGVHPEIVQKVGLSKALEALCQSRRRESDKIRWEIAPGVSGPAQVYRIAEEALDNAVRHSGASTIELVLTTAGELIVRDDGVGFAPTHKAGGLGLLRVGFWGKQGGLRVRLRSTPELGTMIRVNLYQ